MERIKQTKSFFKTLSKLLRAGALGGAVLGLMSCSMLDRRDYFDQMDNQFGLGEPMFRPYDDFQVVPGDSGRFMGEEEILGRVPATGAMREQSAYEKSISREMRELEARLSDLDYEAYSQIKGQLSSNYERIYYLRLYPDERAQYLQSKGIQSKRFYNTQEALSVGRRGEISLGMGKGEVLDTWGAPERRDYAGSPLEGNERWAYSNNGQRRYIYFESGQVEGWTER